MCVCGCVWVCVGVCGCVWVCVQRHIQAGTYRQRHTGRDIQTERDRDRQREREKEGVCVSSKYCPYLKTEKN